MRAARTGFGIIESRATSGRSWFSSDLKRQAYCLTTPRRSWFESRGGYELFDEYLDRIKVVSPDDVMEAAAEYLSPDRMTLVEYLPEDPGAPVRTAETIAASLSRAAAPPAGLALDVQQTA